MRGNTCLLSTCRRSDDTLFNICNPDTIRSLKKSDFIQASDELYMKSLCFTNTKRKQVNAAMMEKYINNQIHAVKEDNKRALLAKLKADKPMPKPITIKAKETDDNSQDVKLLKGMPIIARKTTDKLDIMNNETFTILDINDKTFKIKVNQTPIEIDIKDFSDLFYIAFCMTVFKSQGQTINHEYAIYEWERFDKRMKYVALSRATDKKYIHLN